jgi:uroporphyrinogen decarboxylase
MSQRNDFSRVRQSLLLQGQPDRVPLWELHVDYEVKQAFLGKPIGSEADEVQFWTEAGYDYVPVSAGMLAVGGVLSGEATRVKAHRYSVYAEAEREIAWAAEGQGVIRSDEDFDRFPWPAPEDLTLDHVRRLVAALPPHMGVIVIIGKIFTPVWMLMGFEGFAEACVFNPGLVARMFERIGALQIDCCLRAAKLPGVVGLWMSDDIAYGQGMLVNPALLREHLFPWYRRLGDVLGPAQMPYIFHSDGNLWPVMDDLIACGFNALHPIEPKAMDSRELKAKVGNRLCLLGNVELDRLSRGTPEEIRRMTRRNIDELGVGGGYCVGSSNSVTYYVPLRNYVAMIEEALRG